MVVCGGWLLRPSTTLSMIDENKTFGFFWKGDFDHYFLGHQFEEIFKTRIYKSYLEDKKEAVVLDIGGNLGLFSLYASKYAKQVYIVEPDPELAELINQQLMFNEIKNVKIINKALYIENKPFPFYRNPNRTMNSLHQAVASEAYPPITVEAITLDSLFEQEGIEHVDLMKLDIEGTEIEVLSSVGFKNVADKIDVVVTERHAWAGRNPHQLDEALKNNGFIVTTIPNDADIVVGIKK